MKLSDNLRVWIVSQCQFEMIISWPVWINIIVGIMLVIKARDGCFYIEWVIRSFVGVGACYYDGYG